MSDSEGCDINCTCFRCKGKKRVSRNHIQETSSSDSDSQPVKSIKRRKAARVLSDGQESSETDSFLLAKRKKRKHAPRVMSDEEASSSSGPRPTRNRTSVQVVSESEEGSSSDGYSSSGIDDEEEEEEDDVREPRESDSDSWENGEDSSGWESDWPSEDEFNENDNSRVSRPTKLPAIPSSGAVNASSDSESSGDGQSEKCPICLRNFTSQEVGTPESCDHSFCAICLQEWAKNMNTCPVDRQAFTLILVRSCLEGKIVRRIPVEAREHRDDDEEIQEDPTPCEICGRCDREDRLLLCDECDSGYHLDCLDPPLETVPVEEWFCPECVLAYSTEIAGEAPIGEGELIDLLDDAHATMGTSPIRRRVSRLLPRTRQSERVRTTIIRQEIERQTASGGAQPSTSSGVESLDSASRLSRFFGSRQPTTVTKKVVKKRKKKYRRKVGRRTTTSTRTSTKSTTTTKSKVSVTRKSATSKRKVKKKTKKRKTKRKVDNFDSDSNSSNDPFTRSFGEISFSQSSRPMSKFIVEDSDPDSNACYSNSLALTPSTKQLRSKRNVSDLDDNEACSSKRTRPTKNRWLTSTKSLVTLDSSDTDTGNSSSSSFLTGSNWDDTESSSSS